MLTDYLFFDHESEDMFCVECETYAEACEIVCEYFNPEEVEFVEEITPEEAEIMGYDTY